MANLTALAAPPPPGRLPRLRAGYFTVAELEAMFAERMAVVFGVMLEASAAQVSADLSPEPPPGTHLRVA